MPERLPFDAIVVLGHRPPLAADGGLEHETRMRVERGIALYRAGRATRLLFAGGESTPGVIEADVMARYAEQRGVPARALRRERASRDTIENARFLTSLLREELGRAPRVVLVTSDYHSARATKLSRCAGATVSPEPVPLFESAPRRLVRALSECSIELYYRLVDACARAADG